MKRIAALLVAVMMLVCASAMAEKTVLFTAEDGTQVTFDEIENASLEMYVTTADVTMWIITREGCNPIIVNCAPDTDDCGTLNDLTDEEMDEWLEDSLENEYTGNTIITVETTEAGNKYWDILTEEDGFVIYERWTIYSGFEFNRIMYGTEITAEDVAFMDEVQAAMWVVAPEAAE